MLRSTSAGGSSRPSARRSTFSLISGAAAGRPGRQGDAAVVERAATGRMAEGDQGDGAAGPRRELAVAQAHQRVEAPARQALDAADEEEGLSRAGERQRSASRYSAPLCAPRASCDRLARGFLGGRALRRRLLAGRARPAHGAVAARCLEALFSASMMLTTLAGSAARAR